MVFIGSLIVLVTMMGSVNERTTEIGVFRAIGFRQAPHHADHPRGGGPGEPSGGLTGLCRWNGGSEAGPAVHGGKQAGALAWDGSVAVGSIALALAGGALASLYPAVKASRMDPTEALRAL